MRQALWMLFWVLICSSPAFARSHGKAWENVIIDNRTGYWRIFEYWKTPELLTKSGDLVPLRHMFDPARHKTQADRPVLAKRETEKPPKDWYKSEFDHGGWSRRSKGYGAGQSQVRMTIYGSDSPTELAFIGLRGEFEVKDADAIKDLVLDLEYHGGVVVYVNGKEVARKHLPDGKLDTDTEAEEYSIDAYIKPKFGSSETVRLRTHRVTVRPNMVKKGVNVVAIGVYRAPVRDVLDQTPTGPTVKYPIWAHAYIKRATLHSGWGLTPKTAVTSVDEPEPPKRVPGEDIINTKASTWRVWTRWKTVEILDDAGNIFPLRQQPGRDRKWEDGKPLQVYATPAAPEGWAAPNFDDSEWARVTGGVVPGWYLRNSLWSAGNAASLSMVTSRGKFVVKDPKACTGLRVIVRYYGGVVVYINGKELARKDMPEGDLTPDTLANPYAPPAYLKPTGHLIDIRDAGNFSDHLNLHRVRSFEVEIPADRLVEGMNLVGLAVHRAPAREVLVTGKYQVVTSSGNAGPWPHAGLLSAQVLTSKDVTPQGSYVRKLGRPEGALLWNVPVVQRIHPGDFPDSCESLHEIRIVGCRNGWFGGHVALSVQNIVEDLVATVSDFKGEGATLPASRIEVFYPQADGHSYVWGRSGQFVTLMRDFSNLKPSNANGSVTQPIYLKVHVPRDTPPGEYRATVTINYKSGIRGINFGPEKPISVPIKLTVHEWVLPDAKDYVTFMDFIQSPESVALKFGVPQWSDEHWKWMEKSFELLGQIGNKTAYLPLITRTHFGNSESILRYAKQPDGSHKPDFTNVDRYLDLAEKHCGKPKATVLYLWEMYTAVPGRSKMKPLVTEVDPKTGQVKEVEVPGFDTPEGKEYWTPILRAVRDHLARRGLGDTLGIGLLSDRGIGPDAGRFFDDILPGIRWVDNSHGYAGSTPVKGKGGTPIRYLTTVWNTRGPGDPRYEGRRYGWNQKTIACQFARDLRRDHYPLYVYRTTPEWNITGQQVGLGRFGADFWNVMKSGEKVIKDSRHGAGSTIVHRYPDHSSWAQLVVRTAFLGWSPKGTVPSVHFEAMREGVQNCEARIFIEKALLDKQQRAKLGPDLAKRAQEMLDDRTWIMAHGQRGSSWFYNAGFHDRQHLLYRTAGEVAKALAAE